MSQEWVSTPLYDDNSADHKRIIEEINFGNSLPNMRTWKQAEDSGKEVKIPYCFYRVLTLNIRLLGLSFRECLLGLLVSCQCSALLTIRASTVLCTCCHRTLSAAKTRYDVFQFFSFPCFVRCACTWEVKHRQHLVIVTAQFTDSKTAKFACTWT